MSIGPAEIITMRDYWMHRDSLYPLAWSTDIQANGRRTVDLANQLLARAAQFGVHPTASDSGYGHVNSGWRPAAVNANTPNAARGSRHVFAQAIDIDDDGGALDNWLLTPDGQNALAELGLWLEHPAATKGWCHLQTVPPASGNRVFYP